MFTFLFPILPEIFLFLGSCTILLLNVFQGLKNQLIKITISLLIIVVLMIVCASDNGVFYYDLFVVSLFTRTIKVGVILLAMFQLLSASQFMEKYATEKGDHTVIILFVLVGLNIMVSTNHFILLYVGMEIQALAAYTLTVMQRKSLFASEAGMKYFILGSLASVVYLFGVSYIYGAFGTLNFQEIAFNTSETTLKAGVLGAILVLSSFLFKMGVFPFHQWIPDVYQGAPTPSTSILSTLTKLGVIAVVLQVMSGPFYALFYKVNIDVILTVFAAVSMLVGACVPIVQTHIKRLLGYSAIGHAGFMVMGLLGSTPQGMSVVLLYAIIYSFTLVMTFVCLMSLKNKGTQHEEHNDIDLSQLEGLSQLRPKHAFVLGVCFLSMAGIPPLIGFFPKLLLIQYALGKSALFIASIAILSTVISLFYYLKLIKLMYIDAPTLQPIGSTNRGNKLLLMVFFPVLLLQLLGGYIPFLQTLHQEYITVGVQSLFIGPHENFHT
ncbi:MAG: NADH-quinone oxidoreductase subunit N [Candidatus Paracaedibacteraceae bacterium]|nr:NADH-quinone oxidoreductase subunit N [Candidatus Paracaedibacteraceae bacterium]